MRWGTQYLYVEANNSEVIFHSETVKIFGNNDISRQSIPYSQITAVSFRSSGGLTPTYTLEVNYLGASKPRSIGFSSIPGVSADRLQYEGESLKEYIEQRTKEVREPKGVVYTTQPRNATSVQELIKLKELLDEGLISKEEFALMKSSIISKPSNKSIVGEKTENCTKEKKMNSNNENRETHLVFDKQQFSSKKITRADFMIFDGVQKWNFISKYSAHRNTYFEFCKYDIQYVAARGLSVSSSKQDVLEAYERNKPSIDENYDYRRDMLFIISQKDSVNPEMDLLKECKQAIRYLMIEGEYRYSITYYFDADEIMIMVGYLKEYMTR